MVSTLKVEQKSRTKIGVRFFSQRHFPKGDFPSGNFPNVQFPKRHLSKGFVRPCNWGRALLLEQLPLGKMPLVKYLTCVLIVLRSSSRGLSRNQKKMFGNTHFGEATRYGPGRSTLAHLLDYPIP